MIGFAALALWILTQAAWLEQAYELEFLGISSFVPGLLLASCGLFLVNCWILGIVERDAGSSQLRQAQSSQSKKMR